MRDQQEGARRARRPGQGINGIVPRHRRHRRPGQRDDQYGQQAKRGKRQGELLDHETDRVRRQARAEQAARAHKYQDQDHRHEHIGPARENGEDAPLREQHQNLHGRQKPAPPAEPGYTPGTCARRQRPPRRTRLARM